MTKKNIHSFSSKLVAGALATGLLTSSLTVAGTAFAQDTTTPSEDTSQSETSQQPTMEMLTAKWDIANQLLQDNNQHGTYTEENWNEYKEQLEQAVNTAKNLIDLGISNPESVNIEYQKLEDALSKFTDIGDLHIELSDGSKVATTAKDITSLTIGDNRTPVSVSWGLGADASDPVLGGIASFSKQSDGTFTQGDTALGKGTTENTYQADGKPEWVVKAQETTGSELTSADGKYTFTRTDNGDWVMNISTELTDSDEFPMSSITMSDGSTVSFPVDKISPKTITKGDAQYKTATVSTTSTDKHGTPYTVNMTGSRAYDTTLTLSVTRTPAEGDPTSIEVPNAQNVKADTLQQDYTLDQLDADAVGDQYTLNVNPENVRDITIGETKATLGDNGTRILTTTVTYTDMNGDQQSKTVTVTIPFAAAQKTVGNPEAALAGITVNGTALDGFDPDVLNYTITANADEKTVVTPIARDGQTVKAGDVKQTAWTTVQSWTVEKDGQQRVYTVTLVREHTPEQATADDKFNPQTAIMQDSTVEADSPSDATLASHGYVLNDEYVPVEDSEYQIPEGGVFSYEPKVGQVVRVGVKKTGGMTYKYRLGTLAPDGKTYKETPITVTYLTEATHRAELTGIKVDGQEIKGFDPNKTEYTVDVKNPEAWTVTPQFDKMTGMGVSTHKDGQTATITVSSADNLNTRTYTVHVKQKMKLMQVVSQLANTGVSAIMAAGIAVVLIVAGSIAGVVATRRKRRTSETAGESDTTASDTPVEASDGK